MNSLPGSATTTTPTAAEMRPARIAIEQSLEHVLESLLALGICASDVHDAAVVDDSRDGSPGGLIGRKATRTIESFARLHSIKDSVRDVMVPLEVISSVDQGKNPHLFTKDFIERLAGENMYTNGILSAVSEYRDLLTEQMKDAFPDLVDHLDQQRSRTLSHSTNGTSATTTMTNDHNGTSYGNGNGNGNGLVFDRDTEMGH